MEAGEQGWFKSFLGGFSVGCPFRGNSLSSDLFFLKETSVDKRDDSIIMSWLEITAAEIPFALPISF